MMFLLAYVQLASIEKDPAAETSGSSGSSPDHTDDEEKDIQQPKAARIRPSKSKSSKAAALEQAEAELQQRPPAISKSI